MDVFRAGNEAAKAALFADARNVATVDGFNNFMLRVGLQTDNPTASSTYDFNLITKNRILLEAAYRGSWIAGKVVDSVADDMTRAGIDITTSDKSDLRVLYRNMVRLQIWQSLNFNLKWGRLYGGSLAVMQIEGQNLATPLDPATVKLGQFKGLAVFDRWMLNPDLTHIIQSGPNLGLPEYYAIVSSQASTDPTAATQTGQLLVHHSRVIRATGIDLPYYQAITEMMWGESILERMWDRLLAFDDASLSSGQLINRANLRTIKIEGLRNIIAAGGEAYDGLVKMFDMVRMFQSNEGITLLDKEDDFESTSYTFAGLSDMMLQKLQELSGATDIPIVRLLGQGAAGLNANDEAALRMYYDHINAQQESKLRDPLDTLLKVLWRSTFGKSAPADMEFTFNPLWQSSDMDKANIAKINTDTIIAAHEGVGVSRQTSLKELRNISGDTGIFSNITDEEIAQAEDEPPPSPDLADPESEPEVPRKPEEGPAPKEEPAPAKKTSDGAWNTFFGKMFRRK